MKSRFKSKSVHSPLRIIKILSMWINEINDLLLLLSCVVEVEVLPLLSKLVSVGGGRNNKNYYIYFMHFAKHYGCRVRSVKWWLILFFCV